MSEEAKAKEREKAAARIREKRENEEYRLAEIQRQRAARLASSPEASDSRRQANRQGMSRTRHDPDSSRQQRDVEYSRQYRQANPGYVDREHLRLHQRYHAHIPVRQQWDIHHPCQHWLWSHLAKVIEGCVTQEMLLGWLSLGCQLPFHAGPIAL